MNKKIITLLAALLISSTESSEIFAATNAPKTTGLTSSTVKTVSAAYINDNTDITSKFTDTNFKAKLYSILGKSTSSPILYSDVKNIQSLNVSSSKISSLSGIEYFTSLTDLNCSENNLTSLDFSKNTALKSLVCCTNALTSLDISQNASLSSLDCASNKLKFLDLTNNRELNYLGCEHNEIKPIYLYSISLLPSYNDYTPQYTDSTRTTTTNDVLLQQLHF